MRTILLVLLSLLITACNTRMYIDQVPGSEGRTLAAGETATLRFFTSEPAAYTGLRLTTSQRYRIAFGLVSNWVDGDIETDASGAPLGVTGFEDSRMPLESFALLKRDRQHRWFEFMLYLDGCRRDSLSGISDLQYDAVTDSYLYQAPCSGDLRFFVNDSQGFYRNNTGFASISITRIN